MKNLRHSQSRNEAAFINIDPRGPILPILCCGLVVAFMIYAFSSAPAGVPALQAAQPAAPLELQGLETRVIVDVIDTATIAQDTTVDVASAAISATDSVKISQVLDDPAPVVGVSKGKIRLEESPRNIRAPSKGRAIKDQALTVRQTHHERRTDRHTERLPEPRSRSVPSSDIGEFIGAIQMQVKATESESVTITPVAATNKLRPDGEVLAVAAAAPVSRKSVKPVNPNWCILTGEVTGRDRSGPRSADASAIGDQPLQTLKPGVAIADGTFRVSEFAAVSLGSATGRVRFHGATGRLGGDESGFWINLLSGSLDWEGCDGGTIICAGLRLRGNAQADFRVEMDASTVRITVVSGRVRVTGGAEPVTVSPLECIVFTRDGEIRRATSGPASSTGDLH